VSVQSKVALAMATAPTPNDPRPAERDSNSLEPFPLEDIVRGWGYSLATGRPRIPAGASLAPTPSGGEPLLGHMRQGTGDPLRAFLRWHREVGDIVRLNLLGVTAHMLAHPKQIRLVLQEGARRYTKPLQGRRALSGILGRGLLVSEGEFWLRQRRIAQPAFHKSRIDGFAERMVVAAEDLAREWEGRREPFDLSRDMMRLTLRVVQETLLGTAANNADFERIGHAVDYVNEGTNWKIQRGIFNIDWIPTRGNREFMRQRAVLDEVVHRMIRERRRQSSREDLLSMLLEAQDEETGERMDDEQVRDEVMTIFLAGHETTANALSWTFYLLGRHPEHARRVQAEVREVLGDRAPTASDASKLVYTRMVIQEAMRLYPPAWLLARAPIADEEIEGFFIPARTRIFVIPWVTHRHPALWSDPEGFDPERFRDPKAIDRWAYFPFGGGPRLCIGHAFAMMEATLLLATLARRFHLELVSGHPVEPSPLITLRPKNGVRVVARAL
jgi:cytochrome P450